MQGREQIKGNKRKGDRPMVKIWKRREWKWAEMEVGRNGERQRAV